MGLNAMYQRFVEEYVKDQNATDAYLRAGYKCTRRSARASANKLLTKTDIKMAIDEKIKHIQSTLELETDRTVIDVLRDIQKVKDIAMSEGNHKETLKALELEGKYLGMFSDRIKLEGSLEVNLGLASLLKEVTPTGDTN